MPPKLLQILKKPTTEIKQFLAKNVIGTPELSPVYQQLSTEKKLDHIPKPYFVTLQKSSKLIATCCFCERETILDDQKVKSYYIRYFSFLDVLRVGSRKNKTFSKKNNLIKSEINDLLSGQVLSSAEEPSVFYAYVDPDNERSAFMCQEFGFEEIRRFSAISIGKIFPKNKLTPERLSMEEHSKMKELLAAHYQNYSFYNPENLFFENNYFVVRNSEGEILAGVQANPENWLIHSLPGKNGKLLLKWIGRTPILNRLIKQDYRFLALDYLYVKDHQEAQLAGLIESLMADFQVSNGLVLADNDSSLNQTLNRMNKGLIYKIKKPVHISVIVKTNHLSHKQTIKLKKTPVFLSSFDTT